MTLQSGTRLGAYEIVAPIGAGGMGEVYKAQDTRLDRTVAVKVLSEYLAESPERKQRFEREAKAISQLNHPHICTLHDVGSQDGIDFLVMEHIEGAALAERIQKGALSLDKALEYGIQIADGLDAAHRAGIVHRDLKPANVMVTSSGVKLLDFGLARLVADEVVSDASDAPTKQKDLTRDQAIIGTLQYMAPEQLEGRKADTRTDIFAFGVLLYEMLTGKKAFEGASQASLIAAILERDPPSLSTLKPITPAALERAVEKCLAKEPEGRWHSAHDLRDELEWISKSSTEEAQELPRPRFARWKPGLLGAAATASLGLVLWGLGGGRADPESRVVRMTVNLPPGQELTEFEPMALSPDGSFLAYTATEMGSGTSHVYLRPLDAYDVTPLPGSEGAKTMQFVSPDGEWVGFSTGSQLKRVSRGGGTPVTLADVFPGVGATWMADASLIFSPGIGHGLMKISRDGAIPEPITILDETGGEYAHAWPQSLPGPNKILFDAWPRGRGARVLTLDTGAVVPIGGMESGHSRYVPTGHVIYGVSTGAGYFSAASWDLVAVPFDSEQQEIRGSPQTVVRGVYGAEEPLFTISPSGTLAYLPAVTEETRLVWVDRNGRESPVKGETLLATPRISPDGHHIVGARAFGLWSLNLERGTSARLSLGPGGANMPVWHPDGSRIAFASNRSGGWDLYVAPVDGTAEPQSLLPGSPYPQVPRSWSLDGSVLVFEQKYDIWILPVGGDPEPFASTSSQEKTPRFSPDGRFIVYVSDATGRDEIYVKPYPGPGGELLVSTDGGTQPVWSRDGGELFYRRGNTMMAVSVRTTSGFDAGEPRVLFEGSYFNSTHPLPQVDYDVSPDGQRFLMVKVDDPSRRTRIRIVQNWFAELERLVPAN